MRTTTRPATDRARPRYVISAAQLRNLLTGTDDDRVVAELRAILLGRTHVLGAFVIEVVTR